jgi:hypothetical protein
MVHLNRGAIIVCSFLVLFIGASCSTTKRTSVNQQRRGLLMVEGEHIDRNKGFYKEKNTAKRHKKNVKSAKKKRRR